MFVSAYISVPCCHRVRPRVYVHIHSTVRWVTCSLLPINRSARGYRWFSQLRWYLWSNWWGTSRCCQRSVWRWYQVTTWNTVWLYSWYLFEFHRNICDRLMKVLRPDLQDGKAKSSNVSNGHQGRRLLDAPVFLGNAAAHMQEVEEQSSASIWNKPKAEEMASSDEKP